MSSGPRVIHPQFDWVAFWDGSSVEATPGYVYATAEEGGVFAPEVLVAEGKNEEMEIVIRATNSLAVAGVIEFDDEKSEKK